MLIDTHCHLFSEEFDTDRNSCIEKAQSAGVQKILLPNIDSYSITNLYQTENQYPNICAAMMGLHPTSVKENYLQELCKIKEELDKRNFAGIGEIGMDLYWDKTFLEEQKIVFKTQLQWAVQYNYPVSIHCRNAFDEIFQVLDSMPHIPKGVFHCFTGNLKQAQKIISYNKFKLGIGGVITFKNSNLTQVIENVDIKHFVLETDAPYLAPVPFRGKRNEPAYLRYILDKLSEIKRIDNSALAAKCFENTLEIFDSIKV